MIDPLIPIVGPGTSIMTRQPEPVGNGAFGVPMEENESGIELLFPLLLKTLFALTVGGQSGPTMGLPPAPFSGMNGAGPFQAQAPGSPQPV
jgi:hypothetical protein